MRFLGLKWKILDGDTSKIQLSKPMKYNHPIPKASLHSKLRRTLLPFFANGHLDADIYVSSLTSLFPPPTPLTALPLRSHPTHNPQPKPHSTPSPTVVPSSEPPPHLELLPSPSPPTPSLTTKMLPYSEDLRPSTSTTPMFVLTFVCQACTQLLPERL